MPIRADKNSGIIIRVSGVGVLRCFFEDRRPDGEITIYIDDQELSLGEVGRLLLTHAGWGIRITFLPDDLVEEEPEGEVREPRDGER